MKRYIKSSSTKKHPDTEIMPKELSDRPVFFQLRGGNPTWGGDILRIAESHGGIKVYFRQLNPKTGRLYQNAVQGYAVPDEETAFSIFDEVNERGIVTIDKKIYPKEIDWTNAYLIYVDDYKKGDIKLEYHSYRP